MQLTSKVPVSFHGQTIVAYLATRFTYLPEDGWQQMVENGKITVQGVTCDALTIVAKGDVVGCDPPDFVSPEVNFDYKILYEDQWLLAVNKPPGLMVHGRGKFVKANLIYHLRHQHEPAYPEANLVNRLDTGTSGLVLLARDTDTCRQLMPQFSQGGVGKRYLAVVSGGPSPPSGIIDLPIGPVEGAKVPRFWVTGSDGDDGGDLKSSLGITGGVVANSIGEVGETKEAVTHYRTLKRLSDKFALLELTPETGRTHQLRVHLAAIGHPIVGDARYRMNDDDYLNFVRNPPASVPSMMARPALHSYQLSFIHPFDKSKRTLTAPLAADIEAFVAWAVSGCGIADISDGDLEEQ